MNIVTETFQDAYEIAQDVSRMLFIPPQSDVLRGQRKVCIFSGTVVLILSIALKALSYLPQELFYVNLGISFLSITAGITGIPILVMSSYLTALVLSRIILLGLVLAACVAFSV